jgi:DNA-binding transcriptional ArsR family regulator
MDEYPATIDRTFAALSHPTRRRLLELLAQSDRCVTELAAKFDASLNVVSRHIKSLERAGLVQRSRGGRVHHLRFDATPLAEASAVVEHYRALWSNQLDQLGLYLDKMAKEETKNSRRERSRKTS